MQLLLRDKGLNKENPCLHARIALAHASPAEIDLAGIHYREN
jgi:hypothetical protein